MTLHDCISKVTIDRHATPVRERRVKKLLRKYNLLGVVHEKNKN